MLCLFVLAGTKTYGGHGQLFCFHTVSLRITSAPLLPPPPSPPPPPPSLPRVVVVVVVLLVLVLVLVLV